MIIIKGQDESALVSTIEKALRDEAGVDILQTEEVEYSEQEFRAILAYNAKQTRIYIGRLERNTKKTNEELRNIERILEPVAAYFTYLLAEAGLDERAQRALVAARKATALTADLQKLKNPVETRPRSSNEG